MWSFGSLFSTQPWEPAPLWDEAQSHQLDANKSAITCGSALILFIWQLYPALQDSLSAAAARGGEKLPSLLPLGRQGGLRARNLSSKLI